MMVDLKHTYSDNITGKRIAIFGITPPPLGGVSVHIQRVAAKFKKQNNTVFHFKTEFRGRRFLLLPYLVKAAIFLLIKKVDTIYYHSMSMPNSATEICFLAWAKKWLGYKLILIEHNCRHMYKRKKNCIEKFNIAIKKIDKMIFIGESTYKSYKEKNVYIPKNYIVESAYLHPILSREKEIVKNYPKTLKKFINDQRPLLIANASQLVMYNNQDLYGLDKCITILPKLKKLYPNVGLLFGLSTIGNYDHLKKLQQMILNFGIQQNSYFLLDNHELWPLIKNADLFLRPTQVDGKSVSISEALWLETPVIASNVCSRNSRVTLFDINKNDDFLSKIKNELKKNENLYQKNKKGL